jgi:hypothetical protein
MYLSDPHFGLKLGKSSQKTKSCFLQRRLKNNDQPRYIHFSGCDHAIYLIILQLSMVRILSDGVCLRGARKNSGI